MLQLMIVSSQPGSDFEPDATFSDALGDALGIPDRFRCKFSYVVDKSTMAPFVPILEYLTFSASNRSNSENTIKNKADACYELFLYLDAMNLDYRDLCLENLVEYKERLSAYISPKTNRPLAAGTIKARLQIAREFCVYHKILPADPTRQLNSYPVSGRIAARANGRTSALNVRSPTTLIEYIGAEDLRRIMAALGEPPGRGARRSRDWLISAFCVSTGARLDEALGLTINQIRASATAQPQSKSVVVRLTRTKRSVPRDIAVDRGMVDLLLEYIDGPRKEAISIGIANRSRRQEPSELFVNGPDCAPRYAGLPYQAKRAEEYFAGVQIAIGMTKVVPVYDPDSRQAIGEKFTNRHTIHHLRHTYAIQAWNAYRGLPETDRWIKIQGQLGHKSHQITADIYLRAVKHLEGDARDVMGEYLKTLMVLH